MISLGIPRLSKVVSPTVGKWVGSATIGNRLVGMGVSGTANIGAQFYYGEEFSWASFGTSIVTGVATVNMGYLGATTVNAAGSGIASVIDGKSPWRPMLWDQLLDMVQARLRNPYKIILTLLKTI